MTRKHIATDGGRGLTNAAFGGLDIGGLPSAPPAPAAEPKAAASRPKGRVYLRIEKSGRGGKTVTVLFGEGVEGLPGAEREALLKRLKGALGCGGATDGVLIELQGDVRERATEALRGLGFR